MGSAADRDEAATVAPMRVVASYKTRPVELPVESPRRCSLPSLVITSLVYGSFCDAMSSMNDCCVVKGSGCQAGQKTRPVDRPRRCTAGSRGVIVIVTRNR